MISMKRQHYDVLFAIGYNRQKKNCKFAVLFIDYEIPLIAALLLQNFLHIQKLPAIVHHLVLT